MVVDEVLPSPTSLLESGAEPHYEGHLESVLLWHQNISNATKEEKIQG